MTTHPESCVVPDVQLDLDSDDARLGLTPGRLLADHVDVPISINVFGVVERTESRRPTLERTPAERTDTRARTQAETTRRRLSPQPKHEHHRNHVTADG
jgi:hypothetical protein